MRGRVSALEHVEALARERDRRYAEVGQERERALKIKDEADARALELAREIQTYKDEKANDLRSQIERERGTYATKDDLVASVDKIDAILKPLAEYMTGQLGGAAVADRRRGVSTQWLLAGFAAIITIGGLFVTIALTFIVLIANGKIG